MAISNESKLNKTNLSEGPRKECSLEVSNTRRKLIKGTAALAPIILTLRSGAAIAITSTEQCVDADNRAAFQDPPSWVPNDNLHWVSVKRRYMVIKKPGEDDNEELPIINVNWKGELSSSGEEWRLMPFPYSSYGAEEAWNDARNPFVTTATQNDGGMTPSEVMDSSGSKWEVTEADAGEAYLIVQVDPTGTPMAVGYAEAFDSRLPYVGNSCWASVMPNQDVNELV